jgi:ABC-type polysaccharide/polyol phosphate export permease
LSTPAEVWSYRNLVANLAQRDLKARYKRSVLGWLWSLINPTATLGIYTVVFGIFLRATPPVAGNGTLQNFALYLFCGLVLWNLFSQIILTSIQSFSTAGPLLTRTYFPPECPQVATSLTVILQAFLELGVLMTIMIVVGNVSWTVIFVLPVLALTAAFAFGVGLMLAVLNIRYRDVNYLIGIGLQIAFYLTPIVYPLEIIPEEAQRFLQMNPLTSFVYAMRQATYMLDVPTLGNWIVMVLSATVSLVGGWILFSRMAPRVIEEL